MLLLFIDQLLTNLTYKIINKVSFLLQNLQSKECLYFILSENTLNKIIVKTFFQIESNEGITSFISFIRSLARQINSSTIGFYYQHDTNNFPMIQCLLSYYNHSDDSMNRVNVRNSVLLILSQENDQIENHFIKLPSVTYFSNIVCRLNKLTLLLYKQITSNAKDAKITIEEIINEAGQINDILQIGRKKINFILMNCLFHYYIKPLLLGSIIHANVMLPRYFALFILNLILKILNWELFMNVLFTLLFYDKTIFSKKLAFNKPKFPFGFKFEYEFPYIDITFSDFLLNNYSEEFMKSFINNQSVFLEELNFDEVNRLQTQISKQRKRYTYEENQTQLLIDFTNGLINKIIEKERIMKEHIALSEVLGKSIGYCNNISDSVLEECSFMGNMHELYEYMFHYNPKHNVKVVNNYIKENLFEMLENKYNNKWIFLCKLYTCILMYNCLNRNVSEVIMKKCGINVKSKVNLNKENKNKDIFSKEKSGYEKYIYENKYFINNTKTEQIRKDIISIILNILYIDPQSISSFSYPTIIYDIALKLIYQFIEDTNYLLSHDIYSKIISNQYNIIVNYLQNTIKTKPMSAISFFKEWKQYNLYISNNDKFHCLFTLPENYLLQYLMLDENKEKDEFKNYLHLYMIYHDIYKRKDNEKDLILNKFPLFDFEDSLLNNTIEVDSEEYKQFMNKEDGLIRQVNIRKKASVLKSKGVLFIDEFKLYIANYEKNEKECTFKELLLLSDIEFEKDDTNLQLKLKMDNELMFTLMYSEEDLLEKDYKDIEERKKIEEKKLQEKFENYLKNIKQRERNKM